MLTKNWKRRLLKHLFAKYTLISVFSCLMLFICGVLAEPAYAAQEAPSAQSTNDHATKKAKDDKKQGLVKIGENKENTRKQALKEFAQDPTRPPSIATAQLANDLDIKPEFELTAIFTRNQRQYAVVNGNVVTTGDSLADMVISDISTSTISMLDTASSKQTLVLELNGASQVKVQVSK